MAARPVERNAFAGQVLAELGDVFRGCAERPVRVGVDRMRVGFVGIAFVVFRLDDFDELRADMIENMRIAAACAVGVGKPGALDLDPAENLLDELARFLRIAARNADMVDPGKLELVGWARAARVAADIALFHCDAVIHGKPPCGVPYRVRG